MICGGSTRARSSSSCPRTRPPSSAIKARAKEFFDLTGMEIDIRQDVLSTVQEKCGIDLKGGSTAYQLNYAQDKPMGTIFGDYWADMNTS